MAPQKRGSQCHTDLYVADEGTDRVLRLLKLMLGLYQGLVAFQHLVIQPVR